MVAAVRLVSWGLIGRADNTGLGVLCEEFARNLHPDKVLGIDYTNVRGYATFRKRLPKHTKWVDGVPTDADVEAFLEGLDTVLTFETPYNKRLYDIARAAGVMTVTCVMPEYFHLEQRSLPDLLINPTPWRTELLRKYPVPVMELAIPIATDRLRPKPRDPDAPLRVVHMAGRPARYDRNGSQEVAKAGRWVDGGVEIRWQGDGPTVKVPKGEAHELDHYTDSYRGIDVLVLPRKYGGLCLPMQEAAACGIPTVMLNIEPYRQMGWPEQLRVRCTKARSRWFVGGLIDFYAVAPRVLATYTNHLVRNPAHYTRMSEAVHDWALRRSWPTMAPWWKAALGIA